ncbi:MAG: right-handed parallel beta-helix repeat-containing protein [Cyanobacteria bacterium P01_D01_bin.73]
MKKLIHSPMKRRQVLVGAIALGVTAQVGRAAAATPKKRKITVSSSRELFNAIGSDREIYLEPGLYDLVALSNEASAVISNHVRFREVFDGLEAVIHDVKNLTLVGPSDLSAKIYVRPRYADVLPFVNSRNITIKSLELGHWPDRGNCNGAVVQLTDCDRVNIEDSILFGSGTYGISAVRASTLRCKSTKIHECTYGILDLRECVDFRFKRCQLVDNREFSGVSASQVRRLAFNNCTFEDNAFKGALFEVRDSEPITLKNCSVSRNVSSSLVNDPAMLKVRRTKFANNSFPPL